MDGDTLYEQYLKDADELEKYSQLKSALRKLVEEWDSELIGGVYGEKDECIADVKKLLKEGK